MTTLMLSIFETVNTKRDQATSKPASKQAKATTSDPVTNTDLFFDNCVTLNFWVGELDLETDKVNLDKNSGIHGPPGSSSVRNLQFFLVLDFSKFSGPILNFSFFYPGRIWS